MATMNPVGHPLVSQDYPLVSQDSSLSRPAHMASAIPVSSLLAVRRQYTQFSPRMASEGHAWHLHHLPATEQFTLLRSDALLDTHLPIAVSNVEQLRLPELEQRLHAFWTGLRAREGEPMIYVAVTRRRDDPTIHRTVVHGSRWQDMPYPAGGQLRCIFNRDGHIVAGPHLDELVQWREIPAQDLLPQEIDRALVECERMKAEARDRAAHKIGEATSVNQADAVRLNLAAEIRRIEAMSPTQYLLRSVLRELQTFAPPQVRHVQQPGSSDDAGDEPSGPTAYTAPRARG